MAEWGKGDDRWIVDERKDGQNVNQWHWSEKDCINWTRQRMADLFDGVVLVDGGGVSAKVTGLDNVEGEAFLNIRKKKLIPSYELKVVLSFEGSSDGEGVSGKVRRLAFALPCVAHMCRLYSCKHRYDTPFPKTKCWSRMFCSRSGSQSTISTVNIPAGCTAMLHPHCMLQLQQYRFTKQVPDLEMAFRSCYRMSQRRIMMRTPKSK